MRAIYSNRLLRSAGCASLVCFVMAAVFASGCSNGTVGLEPAEAAIRTPVANSAGDAQTPATGDPQLVANWLAGGAYRTWRCEAAGHAARSPSPHGKNRVCNNAKLAAHGAGEFPVGAASVKEIFDDLGALRAYSIALKVGPGGESGWLWYKQEAGQAQVNARGDAPAAAECNGCHREAGSDSGHSGHDFVYTIVPTP